VEREREREREREAKKEERKRAKKEERKRARDILTLAALEVPTTSKEVRWEKERSRWQVQFWRHGKNGCGILVLTTTRRLLRCMRVTRARPKLN
jgi:hypothetical protein